MRNFSFSSSATAITTLVSAKRSTILCVLLFFGCCALLSTLLFSATVLENTLVPGCATTNGTITEFTVGDYIPMLENEKWVRFSFSYNVENKTIESNDLFVGEVRTSFVRYYVENYSPVGKRVPVAYDLRNSSESYIGYCPAYYGWALLLKVLFGIGVVYFAVVLCVVAGQKISEYEKNTKNENVPLNP